MRKFLYFSLVALIFCNYLVLAQPERMRDRIYQARKEYVLKRLDLNAEQQKKFPPIYDEYTQKQSQLQKQIRYLRIETSTLSLSDAELEADVEKMLLLRQQELDLEKEFLSKCRKILTIKQVVEMYKAEKEFLRTAIRNLREKR